MIFSKVIKVILVIILVIILLIMLQIINCCDGHVVVKSQFILYMYMYLLIFSWLYCSGVLKYFIPDSFTQLPLL